MEAHTERVRDVLAYLCLWCRKQASLGMAGSRTMPCSVLHQDYIIEGITNKVVAPCRHNHEADHQSLERTVAAILRRHIRLTLTTLLHRNALQWQRGNGLPTIYPHQQPVCYSCVSGQSATRVLAASLLMSQRPVCFSCNAGYCEYPGKCCVAHLCTY